MICNSILSFGFQNPILIDEKNVVIAGHGRLAAAKKLKLETVPCIVITWLSDAQIKKYRILDNRLSDEKFSPYDIENLQHEFAELGDPELFDLFPDLIAPDEPQWDELVWEEKSKELSITISFKSKNEMDMFLDEIKPTLDTFKDMCNRKFNWWQV